MYESTSVKQVLFQSEEILKLSSKKLLLDIYIIDNMKGRQHQIVAYITNPCKNTMHTNPSCAPFKARFILTVSKRPVFSTNFGIKFDQLLSKACTFRSI